MYQGRRVACSRRGTTARTLYATSPRRAVRTAYRGTPGPPDEEPVPVLTQHPVHGPEVRGWRTQNGTRSALGRDIARLPELEEPRS